MNCSASRRLTTNQNHVPAWKFLATKNCWSVLKRGFRNPVRLLGTFQNPTRCQSDYISQKKCGPHEWPLISSTCWILIQTVELGLDPGPTVQPKLPIAANDRLIFIAEWWRLLGDTCAFWGALCRLYHRPDVCQARRGYSSTLLCFGCQSFIVLLKSTYEQAKNRIHYFMSRKHVCCLTGCLWVRK